MRSGHELDPEWTMEEIWPVKNFTLALLALVFCIPALAGEAAAPAAEIEKVLENARKIYELAARIEKYRTEHGSLPAGRSARDVVRVFGGGEGLQEYFATDAWGTPYRVMVDMPPSRYSIISAGSDGRFDSDSWSIAKKSESPSDDTVLEDGRFVRSNHAWAFARADKLGARSEDRLRREIDRNKADRTMFAVRQIAADLAGYLTKHDKFPEGDVFELPGFESLPREDAWGTPLRVTVKGNNWRIASAGNDGTFDAGTDLARDLVNENGRFLTTWDTDNQGVDALPWAMTQLELARKEFETAVASRKR